MWIFFLVILPFRIISLIMGEQIIGEITENKHLINRKKNLACLMSQMRLEPPALKYQLRDNPTFPCPLPQTLPLWGKTLTGAQWYCITRANGSVTTIWLHHWHSITRFSKFCKKTFAVQSKDTAKCSSLTSVSQSYQFSLASFLTPVMLRQKWCVKQNKLNKAKYM